MEDPRDRWEKISGVKFDAINTVDNNACIFANSYSIPKSTQPKQNIYIQQHKGKVVYFEYINAFTFRINANGYDDLLTALDNHLNVFAPNFYFNPKYTSGVWDGKIRFWNKFNGQLSIGLLFEIAKFIRNQNYVITVDDELKKLIKSTKIEFDIDLPNIKFKDKYEFQYHAVQKLLNYRRGIVRIATGGGKGVMIVATCKGIYENLINDKILIIVPRTQLVEQLYKEFNVCGWGQDLIGKYHGDIKEVDKTIIIATWQSLSALKRKNKNKYKTFLNQFNSIIVDEVHTAQAKELKDTLDKCKNAYIRFGFTGTMPTEQCNLFTIKSSIGEVLWVEGAKKLQDKGVLSPIDIHEYQLVWPKSLGLNTRTFQQERKLLEENAFRNALIKTIVKNESKKGNNILILVEKINHGKYLTSQIDGAIFIHGGIEIAERELVREKVDKESGIIIVATYGTFQMGINMKNLRTLIFAISGKSSIRTIQSIGRGLRKAEGKTHLSLFDITDNFKYAKRHQRERNKIYCEEKWEIQKKVIKISENML